MDMSKYVTTGVSGLIENDTQETVITLSANFKLISAAPEKIKAGFDSWLGELVEKGHIESVQTEYNEKEKTTRISMATDNKGANVCG